MGANRLSQKGADLRARPLGWFVTMIKWNELQDLPGAYLCVFHIDMTSQSQKSRKFFNPASLLLIFGLLIGGVYSVFIPYGAGFDEEQHVLRVFDIARLHFMPNSSAPGKTTSSYLDFIALSYQRRYFQSPAFDLLAGDKFLQPIDKEQIIEVATRSIYPPVTFFPQAVLARIFWLKYDFPIIPINILMRLAGLLVYLLGAYVTIRILPVGKWVFLLLALSPMALYQAATLNVDGFTNAACFLFIGLALMVYTSQETPMRRWKAWALAGACLLLSFTKPTSIFLLPLLLIVPFRKFQSKTMLALIGMGAVLAVVFTGLYSALSISGSHFADQGDMSLSRQLQIILANPVDFMATAVKGNLLAAGAYFKDWVGVYGHWDGVVPEVVYWLYPLALVAALLAEAPYKLFSTKARIYTLCVFLAGATATVFMYYYVHYSPDELASLGKQGRYFIFIAPLLYIALAGLAAVGERWARWARLAATGLLAGAILFFSLGIYVTYYSVCGSAYYTFKPCTQPNYKNLDTASAPEVLVNSKSSITQGISSVCGKLTGVRVLVKSVPAASSGSLRFTLLDHNARVVAAQEFALASLQPDTWLSLAVPSMTGQVNPGYTLQLDSQNLPAPQGVGIATSKSDHYRDGELLAAGKKIDGDLIFQYSCISPWQKAP